MPRLRTSYALLAVHDRRCVLGGFVVARRPGRQVGAREDRQLQPDHDDVHQHVVHLEVRRGFDRIR